MKQTLHIYTRVSTQTQQDEGTSLDSQRDLGIKKAEQMGFEYKLWNEGGASSNYEDFENRPVLLQLLTEIDKGNVKHLWVYNNDRLSRNDITAHTIRVKLQSNAVTLYTNNGQFDLTNPQDGFLKTILDAVAQLDNAQRAERTRQGKLARVKQGFWMGGPPPYGYQLLDKKLVLHPEESQWVKRIYEWYYSGKSTEWIKSELDKSGVLPRRQKSLWTLGSLQKILKNTHFTGEYTYTDSKTEETIQCKCPPIISKTLWNNCQEKRKKALARRGQNNRTQRFYLLRNLMFCGHCGSPISGRIKEDKNEYLYYCPKKEREWVKSAPKPEDKWKRGRGCSMTRSLNIPRTDSIIKREAFKILLNPKFLREAVRKHQEASSNKDSQPDLKTLQNKEKRFVKERNNLINNIADVKTAKLTGNEDAEVADRILNNLEAVLRETDSKIEQCKIQMANLQQNDDIFKDMMPSNIKGNFDVPINKETIQKHLNSFINRIDVFYDAENQEHELKVRFKIPVNDDGNEISLDVSKTKRTQK